MSFNPLKTSGRSLLRRSPFSPCVARIVQLDFQEHDGGRRLGLIWALSLALVTLAGCARANQISAGAAFYAGTFEASCSPVDAPAIQFELYRLGDPTPSQVSIGVWQLAPGAAIELNGHGGYAAAFIGGTEWIPAAEGVILLENYVEGELASGWFWVELDGIDRFEGRFEATWSNEGIVICG